MLNGRSNRNQFAQEVQVESKALARGFMQFLLRGNVVDLAVAVVIGAAAGSVITSFVRNIFSPLVAAIFGTKSKASDAFFVVNHSKIMYGEFLNAFVSFLLIAIVVYFFVITPTNKLVSSSHFKPPPDPSTRKCPDCLSEIPISAKRCAYCTAEVTPLEAENVSSPRISS